MVWRVLEGEQFMYLPFSSPCIYKLHILSDSSIWIKKQGQQRQMVWMMLGGELPLYLQIGYLPFNTWKRWVCVCLCVWMCVWVGVTPLHSCYTSTLPNRYHNMAGEKQIVCLAAWRWTVWLFICWFRPCQQSCTAIMCGYVCRPFLINICICSLVPQCIYNTKQRDSTHGFVCLILNCLLASLLAFF